MDRLSGKEIRVAVPAVPPPAGRPIAWTITGAVGTAERDQAEAAIGAVLDGHRRAVDHPRVRITGTGQPGGLIRLQVNLRVNGAPARVQAAARTMPTAITEAASRLHRQLLRLTTQWQPWPWPDPQRRPLAQPQQAPICRMKSFRLPLGMACQAAAHMNAMDYDVFLYTDAETGEDAVIYRAGPTGVSLARQRTMRPPSQPTLVPLTVNPRKTPILTPGQAAVRLAEHWLPFLFYTDYDSRRGNLLYRRYDGDLGLIAPTSPGVEG